MTNNQFTAMLKDIPNADKRMEQKIANDKYEYELNKMDKKVIMKGYEDLLLESFDLKDENTELKKQVVRFEDKIQRLENTMMSL